MSFDVATMLGPDGAIARRLSGYESRPEQLEMAASVEKALDRKGRLLVEAGTGVGKSFAYLVPAIKRIVTHSERIVIATHTISLQEQLMERDVPLLNAVIPEEFSAVLVKGRGNYVSIRRLKLACDRQERLFDDDGARHTLEQVRNWAYETRDGTLSTLPQLERPEVWDHVQSDSHNCMGRKCETYNRCFYQAARRRMENGDLLICNHALFFADLALRAQGVGFLPAYDHVILDEAHGIEDVASDHFGVSLSESRVMHLLRVLYNERTGRGFLATVRTRPEADERLTRTIDQLRACAQAAAYQFDALRSLQERTRDRSGRIDQPDAVENVLSDQFKRLSDQLNLLKPLVMNEPDEYEMNSYAQRALDVSHHAELLIGQKLEHSVYWTEQSGRSFRGRPPRITIRCAPIEVGPLLREHLFGRDAGVVMTSATLATGVDDFSHVASRLGCEEAETLQLGSPFDHASQVELIVDRSLPEPSHPDFAARLAPCILRHVEQTDGGAFVLFTSFSMLNSAAEQLRAEFVRRNMPILVQGQDGPRNLILQRFRENDRSVLFGTSSFWQGVDVRGRALRNVIITRLPFDVPDLPLIKARLDRIREQGGNPFMDDQLPRAIIRFKQGFGRLIRSKTDTGRVVVLDSRIITKPYGRRFLASLPEGVTRPNASAVGNEPI